MPRIKRKTRPAESRQPKAPEGEEGKDLEQDIKAEKLKTLLADFDAEMATFFDSLREDMRDFEKAIECSYRVSISKLPKYIREMDIEDYLKLGGQMTVSSEDHLTQQIEMSLDMDPALATLTKSKKKTKKKTKTSTSETDTVKRPTGRQKKAILPPPSSTRTIRSTRQRAQFETPFQRGGPSAAGWETPLVTPKFDPRLPVTPTMTRRPKTGEVIMSMAGSPIINENAPRTSAKVVPSQNSVRLMMDNMEIDLENIQIPDYEQTTRDYLRLLKEKLMAIPLSPAQ